MADNPYFIQPANPLAALMTGVGGYESAQKRAKQAELETAFKEVGQQVQAGGIDKSALGRLFGLGPAAAPMIAAAATLGKGETTDEIKEYNLSKQQGFAGSFTDWKTALKKAGATSVNVNTGEKAYDKELNEAEAKRFIELQKGSAGAVKKIATLDAMDQLTQHPDFYSGTGADRFVLPLKQAIGALGGDPAAGASMEAFRALSSRALLDAAGGSLGAGVSNADTAVIAGTVPNLSNTPEGNRQLIGMQRKLAQREQEVFKLARVYAANNKGRIDAGFDEFLADWANKNPLFSQAKPSTGQGGTPASSPVISSPARSGQPTRVKTKAERDALEPGTPYIAIDDPDGVVRTR